MKKSKQLLKATDIEKMPGERKVHFLNPNAVRVNRSLGDAVGLHHLGVHLVEVAPGNDTTEYHKHLYEEECIYVLSGQGRLTLDGETYPLAKGDFVGFPRDTGAHAITNDASETLICLVMGQRLEQDVADYPLQGKRLYRNSGKWNLVEMQHIVEAEK